MTDATPAPAPAPAPAEPASTPTGAGPSPSTTPADIAAAGLETLAANKKWRSDFDGASGRPAQLAAAKLKSEVTRSAFNPEADTNPAQPESVESAQGAVTQAAAEAMAPGQDPSEYSFKWENSADFEIGELQNMSEVAKQAAFDVGANPHFARATIEAMDRQLSKEGSYTPTNSDALDDHLHSQLGDKADATLQGALATFEKMPPEAQAWLQNSLSRLDTSTAAWAVQRLAAINRANSA